MTIVRFLLTKNLSAIRCDVIDDFNEVTDNSIAYRYVQVILSYELVQMLQIATLKVLCKLDLRAVIFLSCFRNAIDINFIERNAR